MMIKRPRWHEHTHVRTGKELSAGERAADFLKHWFGTWTALGLVALIIGVWMTTGGFGKDPLPFLFLNLFLSCVAAVQGIILQISANRGDRISSEVALSTQHNSENILEINKNQTAILKGQDAVLAQQSAVLAKMATIGAEVDRISATQAQLSTTQSALAGVIERGGFGIPKDGE